MSESTSSDGETSLRTGTWYRRLTGHAVFVMVMLSLIAVAPVAAQSNSVICNAEPLPGIIETLIRVLTFGGLLLFVAVFQWRHVLKIIQPAPEKRTRYKGMRTRLGFSAAMLVSIGPLYEGFAAVTQLPLAECVNVVPW